MGSIERVNNLSHSFFSFDYSCLVLEFNAGHALHFNLLSSYVLRDGCVAGKLNFTM